MSNLKKPVPVLDISDFSGENNFKIVPKEFFEQGPKELSDFENYRITKNKYDNNLVNTTELLDANVLLLQSKINLAVSKADVLMAYSQLLKTSGLLSTQIQ